MKFSNIITPKTKVQMISAIEAECGMTTGLWREMNGFERKDFTRSVAKITSALKQHAAAEKETERLVLEIKNRFPDSLYRLALQFIDLMNSLVEEMTRAELTRDQAKALLDSIDHIITCTFAKAIPRKRESVGETECRRVLENLFRKPFPNQRPEFMKNSITGSNLELDCFNEELRLAVEYHGRQHYEYVPRFHPHGKQSFYNQKYRDKETKELCAKNGILLIEVPYKIAVPNIRNFIIKKLRESGRKI